MTTTTPTWDEFLALEARVAALERPAPAVKGSWMSRYPFGGDEYYLKWNKEQQYFCTPEGGFPSSTGYQAFATESSHLSVVAEAVGIPNPAGQPWNSGCLTSCCGVNGMPAPGLFAAEFGYHEMRCVMSSGGPPNGFAWPAFVLYPLSGGGEIDIFEWLSGQPNRIYQTIHAGADSKQYVVDIGIDWSTGWHTYGCNHQPDYIDFYVDGARTVRWPTPPMLATGKWYINCPLTIGGPGSWQGAPPVAAPTTRCKWLIDYIGVYTDPRKSQTLFFDDFTTLHITHEGGTSSP